MLCGSEKWADKATAPVVYFRGGRRHFLSYNCIETLGTISLRNFFPAGIKFLRTREMLNYYLYLIVRLNGRVCFVAF
jgi:hypothetical protein